MALVVLGVGLIVMPFAFDMFNRAPKGAAMIVGFRPFMTERRLDGFQHDIKKINAGVRQSENSVVPYLGALPDAGAITTVPASTEFSTFSNFAAQWGSIDSHMTRLLDEVQGNLGNYEAVAALPRFSLFPWFFVIPGVLVLALMGGFAAWPRRRPTLRWVLVAIGLALILAPAVFQMFQRAPKGGEMMSAFRTIETTSNVETIQSDFGSMAVGQGSIRLELLPALQKAGLTETQINVQFPAVAALDRQWVHILNDMTPMIGAMSDNVANYQAVAALPPFPLFPYFFVLPGLLIAGAALAAGPVRRSQHHRLSVPSGVQSPDQ